MRVGQKVVARLEFFGSEQIALGVGQGGHGHRRGEGGTNRQGNGLDFVIRHLQFSGCVCPSLLAGSFGSIALFSGANTLMAH